MSDGAGSRTGVAGALGLSVTSSVAIVICNKYLISTLGFFFGQYVHAFQRFQNLTIPPKAKFLAKVSDFCCCWRFGVECSDDADELAPHGDLLHAVRCPAAALL